MNDIKKLTDRFLTGETTREEEQQLYRAFRRGPVPQELEYLRGMLADLEAVQEPLPAVKKSRKWMWWAAAACVAALIAVATLPPTPPQEGRGETKQLVAEAQAIPVTPFQEELGEKTEEEVQETIQTVISKPAPQKAAPRPLGVGKGEGCTPTQEAIERAQRLLDEQRMMAMVEEALESEEVQQIIKEYSRDIIYTVSL